MSPTSKVWAVAPVAMCFLRLPTTCPLVRVTVPVAVIWRTWEPVVMVPIVKFRVPVTAVSRPRVMPALLATLRPRKLVLEVPPIDCMPVPLKVTEPVPPTNAPPDALLVQSPPTAKVPAFGAASVPPEIVTVPAVTLPPLRSRAPLLLLVRLPAPLAVPP